MKKQIPLVLVSLVMLASCSGTRPLLGVNHGQLMPCPETPNCVSSHAADENHYIPPIRFKGTQEEAQGRLLKLVASEKRTRIVENQDDYLRVEFTSALFRFVDDLEFYFPANQGDGTIIHIRSASRVGYTDFGANRRRVEKIRSQF